MISNEVLYFFHYLVSGLVGSDAYDCVGALFWNDVKVTLDRAGLKNLRKVIC